MRSLPITQVIPEVKEKLQKHNRLVLQAPPGAGKTTALPLALLDEAWLKGKKILMLEPRRLAVRSSAARMAELLNEKVGQRIGYQIKMDSVQSKATQILIVTEGILTRKLQNDPSLEDVALIIFDEFHERSLHADLSLALALESQSILREDLKILIMSATLNTTAVSKLLNNAPLVESKGRSFPVERIYLDKNTPQPTKKEIPVYVHKLLIKILSEEKGNILVFLSGVREIKAVEKLLTNSKPSDVFISSLYGNLSKEAQDRAIKAPPKGSRKVVLSTNIAQTSLTIEGITVVVDSGLQNVSVFNPFSGMDRLETRFISKDAATQRAGRAGRLSAGKAYHLWHKSKILLEHDIPEILLADLSQMVLELALWGNEDITSLAWMDTPPSTAVTHARQLLVQLGALDEKGTITSHGKAMSTYGLHPRLAHMMLKAKELDLAYEASLLAVLLTEKDIYHKGIGLSDIRERVILLHHVAQKVSVPGHLVNLKQCHYLLANAKRLEKVQKKEIDTELLGVLLSFAYPDRIAALRYSNTGTYLLSNGKGATLHKEDELYDASYLVVCDLDAKSTNANIYKACEITRDQIEAYLELEISDVLTWNEEQQRVEARSVQRVGAITLKETQISPSSKAELAEEIQEVLLDELEALGLGVLNWSKEAKSLKERVSFLNFHGLDFPDFSDTGLLKNMDEWLAPYLAGITTLKACQNLDLHQILLGRLSFEQTQLLDRLAPEKLKVASGSNITLDYSDPEQPVLAVRLQEMFGTRSTPTVLNGKVKLMIHLLSPASRPMQVTQDLESFWKNTYDEVKKELRGKYKKHYWPDDPLEAQATSKTRKYM
ncbi:ATP-dependent helicase HrpB [Sulfurovum riftiae]|uniref:ATP-dependent helicase n=1 Tax=Sulfurovum riftiae TaxID=1630136 RepID=A0A151CGG1_9BACT|nr:ATP-dependent helicase HrpB [Sulfurovum riftiae]KYJ86591.1 ATP-dependent helicase [Sulfurovum riftiae]